MSSRRRGRVLPGFGLSLGVTLSYLSLIVLAPLAALLWKAGDAGLATLWAGISSERAVATYRLTLGTALAATAFNAVVGFLLAWVLARYRFPGRRLLDAVVDLPFALPTAVAGIALSAIFAPTGWAGALLEPLGLKVAYAPAGIAVAMAFTSIPFVVRSLQPVLEDLEPEVEEAAFTLGAGDLAVFARVIFPALLPAFLSGCALAFSRALGEFGAIIFIAGNIPMETEVTTLLTYIRLEEFDYPGAAGLAAAMLALSFVTLFVVNALQLWRIRREGRA
ncbi:sulfate ABC transporter permease subunit CysT [Caulobacter mirabilis]|uniref:Sulfate transport system permease protein CysT n=1 Tax=Caulobacter mirabilis TaxID=69666 RepID=A0A2D2AT70_9CAUL|nr:sulfate ABC transporter permease subunit CysT [Caulobacter mirabilis]ATQ41191.1 sulfate ABC transporter permease subunit CysT [Caulobacter mirabilis]